MLLKINVGASRRVTDNNYGSRGASAHMELEFDAGLIAEPAKLKEKLRQMFNLVRESLAEELQGTDGHHSPENRTAPPAAGTNGHFATQAAPETNGRFTRRRENSPRPSTPSQCKALFAIARSQGIALAEYLRDQYRVGRPEDLSLQQASRAIDDLRAVEAQSES